MEKQELFTQKGELITQIEIAQAKLQDVNKKIFGLINLEEKHDNERGTSPNS